MTDIIPFPIHRAAPPRPTEATGIVLHMPAPRHFAAADLGFADSIAAICYQDGDYFVVDLPTWFS